jgi:hypothetical protein
MRRMCVAAGFEPHAAELLADFTAASLTKLRFD